MSPLKIAPLALFLILAGCFSGDPMEAQIPSDPAHYEGQLKPHSEKLSLQDQRLLAAYLDRKIKEAPQGAAPVANGTTIRQALDAQSAWERNAQEKENGKK